MKPRVTLSDVAREAGVSKSTVSFVLNKSRPISEAVTRKVLDTVAKLNYTPNEVARMLSCHCNKIIGVLVITCNDPFSGVILECMNQEITARGYRMQLCIVGEGHQNAVDAMNTLSAGGMVDGIVNMLPALSVSETLRYCNGVPTITYMRTHITSPVYLDFIAGIHSAMDYLYSHGHRRIGFIGQQGRHTEQDLGEEPRQAGFKQYLSGKNLEDNLALIELGNGTMESGIQLAHKLYAQGATAIVCINDQTAAGVLFWCHENFIKVPEQLSVVGFDDSPIANYVYPPLTTIHIPARELAEMTIDAIIDKINGKNHAQHRILTPRLIVRKSVGTVPEKNLDNINA